VKPQNAFASKAKRFENNMMNPQSASNPGPGQYHQGSQWGQKKHSEGSSWNKQSSHALMPNPPSIPSHNNVYGYEENAKGELIRQTNSEKVYAGDGRDCVGPGNYEISHAAKQAKGPTKWIPPSQKSTKLRAIQREKLGMQPGPGHYQPAINSVLPLYKHK